MPIKVAIALFLVCSCDLSGAEPGVVYFPLVIAYGDVSIVNGTFEKRSGWESKLGVFNPTNAAFDVVAVGAYGNGAVLGTGFPSLITTTVEARAGSPVRWALSTWPSPGVAFLALQAPSEAIFSADVAWVHRYCGCTELDCIESPQGQASLPVYRGTFPAGSTAIAGPVELGSLVRSSLCASVRDVYRRRVNVTLFNAGDRAASFKISELAVRVKSTPLYESVVQVGAKEVLQVNSISVPTESSNDTFGSPSGDSIWFEVTADQPFLYYVSTVFDDPGPGALPFQVYPATKLR
jgi:hypothetical protein